ncbi:replication/maintenance protein RepL [Porifericola rhodea]|uniref:replication/maintenance protein RepL n=1 Tax=Porifericola rhodea TaxID=930972 RepID=UPI002665583C|nr:replication/maintenance protein RepL [Porifericola rhodea]WKN30280.1 replication/maintenance protein RepL [Porifericola rhodea]
MEDKMNKALRVQKAKDTIRYERWINAETGEEREFAIVEKPIYKNTHFYLTFLPDLLQASREFGKGKKKVLLYILNSIDSQTHLFIGKYREIAEETKTSQRTISETIAYLLDIDFLRKKAQSVYIVSPRYVSRGEGAKKRDLMVKYQELAYTKQEAEAMARQLSII